MTDEETNEVQTIGLGGMVFWCFVVPTLAILVSLALIGG